MKTAIVTGASRGIGRETAIMLADEYDLIAINSLSRKDSLDQVRDIILSKNKLCISSIGDLGDSSYVDNFISSILIKTNKIDLVVNNAGISLTGLFADTTVNDWDNIINSNIKSIFNICHKTIPNMVFMKSGKIINISSVWGLVGSSCEVLYSATKGSINSFTKALAKELAPSGISVNAIAFGMIDTEMNNTLSKDELHSLENEIPFGRIASTKEAASAIVKISSMPSYFTGEIIKFDGGWI